MSFGNLLPKHGTKILGGVITVIGVFEAADPATMQKLFGNYGPAVTMLLGGVITMLRGFQNTSNIQSGVNVPLPPNPPPPPPPGVTK